MGGKKTLDVVVNSPRERKLSLHSNFRSHGELSMSDRHCCSSSHVRHFTFSTGLGWSSLMGGEKTLDVVSVVANRT